MQATTLVSPMDCREKLWKSSCWVICMNQHVHVLFFTSEILPPIVPPESSSVTEVYFRLTTLSPTQQFGDQVNVSNCIQSLEVLVRRILDALITMVDITLFNFCI